MALLAIFILTCLLVILNLVVHVIAASQMRGGISRALVVITMVGTVLVLLFFLAAVDQTLGTYLNSEADLSPRSQTR
jgi:hypothetical protein